MATIHVAGVRGVPCGAVRWTLDVYQLLNWKMQGETLKCQMVNISTYYKNCAVLVVISHSVSSWKNDDIFYTVNSQEVQDFFGFQHFTSINELAKKLTLFIGRNYFCILLTWRVPWTFIHWTIQESCVMKKRVKESLVSILIKTANICYNFSIMQYFHPLQKFEVQVCKFFIYIYILYGYDISVPQC